MTCSKVFGLNQVKNITCLEIEDNESYRRPYEFQDHAFFSTKNILPPKSAIVICVQSLKQLNLKVVNITKPLDNLLIPISFSIPMR